MLRVRKTTQCHLHYTQKNPPLGPPRLLAMTRLCFMNPINKSAKSCQSGRFRKQGFASPSLGSTQVPCFHRFFRIRFIICSQVYFFDNFRNFRVIMIPDWHYSQLFKQRSNHIFVLLIITQ